MPSRLNVFLPAPPPLEPPLESLARALEARGVVPFVRRGKLAHCTLFMAVFPDAAAQEVIARAQAVLARAGAVELRPTRVRRGGSWLFLDVEATPALRTLNLALADGLRDLRDRSAPMPSWVAGRPELERRFAEFGSPSVGEGFEPHFTLVANAPAEIADAIVEWSARSLVLPGEALSEVAGIGQADDDGQPEAALTWVPLR